MLSLSAFVVCLAIIVQPVAAQLLPVSSDSRELTSGSTSAADVSIDQCFIQERGHEAADSSPRFLLSGGELAACIENDRILWLVRGELGDSGATASLVELLAVGARQGVVPHGEDLLPGVVNRFHGSPEQWRTALPTWRGVRYDELWQGIDLLLEAEEQTFKSTYRVAPGADPSDILWAHHGADGVHIDSDGRLIVDTAAG
ncbi:MAG: hypothetical protein ACI9EF_003843, partial [Pseudohongiellaceae bacterium]